jgi:hypothetical protein
MPKRKKKLVFGLVLVLAAVAGASWWLLGRRSLDAFQDLPANPGIAWQVDFAALRRSPLVQEGLRRLPPDLAARLDGSVQNSDLWAGVAVREGERWRTASSLWDAQGQRRTGLPGTGAEARVAEMIAGRVTPTSQVWLVADLQAMAGKTIELAVGNTTLQLPPDLFQGAQMLAASGEAGALGVDLKLQLDFDTADAVRRGAASLRGFLAIARAVVAFNRKATADVLWDQIELKEEGTSLVATLAVTPPTLLRLYLWQRRAE